MQAGNKWLLQAPQHFSVHWNDWSFWLSVRYWHVNVDMKHFSQACDIPEFLAEIVSPQPLGHWLQQVLLTGLPRLLPTLLIILYISIICPFSGLSLSFIYFWDLINGPCFGRHVWCIIATYCLGAVIVVYFVSLSVPIPIRVTLQPFLWGPCRETHCAACCPFYLQKWSRKVSPSPSVTELLYKDLTTTLQLMSMATSQGKRKDASRKKYNITFCVIHVIETVK